MKIGILGNMNNMYFSLARYLADEGYDCELLLFDNESDHFHPSADTFLGHPKLIIKQLTWGDAAHFLTNRHRVAADLQPYQFLIGSGTAPAFTHAAGRVLDLFVPYGNDLYQLPFGHLVNPLRQLSYWTMAWHQLRGIRESPCILFDKTNPAFDRVFTRLRYRGKRIISPPPLFYYREYEKEWHRHQEENPFFSILQTLRKENDLLVLQHIRQFWKRRADRWSLKGNEHLINGFAKFTAAHPSVKGKLLLFEYGIDVQRTKRLIDQLNLNDRVVWFPKTLRKNLMAFIQMSDVVVGELHHAWNTYCVVMETLAMAKPLIHKRNDAYLSDVYPELYPMFNAGSADDVCSALQQVLQNEKEAAKLGQRGKVWFDEYCVRVPLRHIIRLINEKRSALHEQNTF